MEKIKLNLDGLKPNIKRGFMDVDIAGDLLTFPLLIKNELAYRQALNSADIKLKASLSSSGEKTSFKPVNFAGLSPAQKSLVKQAEGFDINNQNYIAIYDEAVLLASASERNFIVDAVSLICNIDFEYIVDEEKGIKYIDLFNEKFQVNLKPTDYVGIANVMFEQNILTAGVSKMIEVNVEALKRGEDVEITLHRHMAREMGRNEEEWIASVQQYQEELNKELQNKKEDNIREEDKPKKVVKKPTKKVVKK